MKKLLIKNKKGVLGLDTARQFILLILTVAVISFAVVIALGTLNNTNILETGSVEANQTTNVLRNVSGGVERFFQDAGTWFVLLSVVIIILIIAVVVVAVSRFGQTTGNL